MSISLECVLPNYTQRASFAAERLHDNIPVRALRHDGTRKGHRVFLEIENGFIGELEEHDFRHDAPRANCDRGE